MSPTPPHRPSSARTRPRSTTSRPPTARRPGRIRRPGSPTPWSAAASAPASPSWSCCRPRTARSRTARSAPWTCPPPSVCPTAPRGPRAASPASCRRSRAWSSTRPTACSTPPGTDPGSGGTKVSADVEGLTLLTESDGDGYLLASSQGDNTFAAYDRELEDAGEYEGGFRVAAANDTLDGSEECDGGAVLNASLGSKYPNGLCASAFP